MIFAKIYLDTHPEKGEVIVIEAAGEEDGIYLSHAKTIYDKNGDPRYNEVHTSILYAGNIVISPEAREAFLARLYAKDGFDVTRYGAGDFQIHGCKRESYGGWDPGRFAFRPDKDEAYPLRRILGANDRFVLSADRGINFDVFNYMTEAENAFLKTLDLSEPITKDVLFEWYFSELAARGEEPPVTVEAIRKIPARFLTEAQKKQIRREYRNDCNHYDSQDWHYHADFIYNKIVSDLAERFNKSFTEIEKIIA